MKKRVKIAALLTTFLMSSLMAVGLIRFSHQDSTLAKADSLTNLGEVSLTGIKHYDPYWNNGTNVNEHFIFQLEGSDYPESVSDTIRYISKDVLAARFTHNIDTHLVLKDRSGATMAVNDYWEAYFCQFSIPHSFSYGLAGFGNAATALIKKGFKIPSYAVMRGNASSETYGYYTVDKDYVATLNDTSPRSEGLRDWTLTEYNPRNVTATSIYSYVDEPNEFLTFNLSGGGLDYPTASGEGNFHLSLDQAATLLPNFKEKVHFYKENGDDLPYNIAHLITIDLWQISPRISIGIDVLPQAKKVHIEPGLILPSYARYLNNTSSEVYDGFIVLNDLFLTIDSSAVHQTGAQIPWLQTYDNVGVLSLSNFYTYNPFGNNNEFFVFCFNERTDYSGAQSNHIDQSKVKDLFANFQTHFLAYDENNNPLTVSIWTPEVVYNYHYENSILIMIQNAPSIHHVVLKEGLIIPSYHLANEDMLSPLYGNYTLGLQYELTIPEGHSHVKDAVNVWELPKCNVEYYDESDNLISSLSSTVVPGGSSNLPVAPEQEGYTGHWKALSPADLVIDENGDFTAPLAIVTIKFKLVLEKILVCEIEYYDENDNLFDELSNTVICGSEYTLEPIISKKGHDGSWVVKQPSGLVITNNKIIAPNEETTIKFQAHYEPRTYLLSFSITGVEPKEVVFGQRIGTLPAIPERPGFTGHWMIDEEVITEDTIYNYDVNKVATVDYTDRYCVLTFNSNGGSEIEPIEILYGNVISRLPIPIKDGFFFTGWFTDEALTNKFEEGTEILDDYLLYAGWAKECVVTFDTNGGSLIQSVSLAEGTKLTKPTDPTKEGYEFVCWTLNGNEYNFDNPVTSSITLVAKWKASDKPVEPKEKNNNNINGGALALIIGSSVLLLGGLGFLGYLLFKKKKVH